jgi:hypothetical protein
MVQGLADIDSVDRFCDSCLVAKQRRSLFPTEARFRANGALQLLHGDLCGPISPKTFAGSKYFLLLVDDHTRYMWLVLIKSKDEALIILLLRTPQNKMVLSREETRLS